MIQEFRKEKRSAPARKKARIEAKEGKKGDIRETKKETREEKKPERKREAKAEAKGDTKERKRRTERETKGEQKEEKTTAFCGGGVSTTVACGTFRDSLARTGPSEEEKAIVAAVHPLAVNWGYRQGAHGAHTKFEKGLKNGSQLYYTLIPFTDPLFRLLQQGRAFSGELVEKFDPFYLQDVARVAEARQYLKRFLARDPSHVSALCTLAQVDLSGSGGGHTWFFGALSVAAKILLLIVDDRVPEAIVLARSFSACMRAHGKP
jgi:hypothetical protein